MALSSTKSITQIQAEASEEGEHTLKRSLTATNLVMLGIGAIIGAGIFVLTGTAAANNAGPAVVWSFVLAGFGCLFAGLCYAEFASMIPVAGSAYTYAYATLGEFVAWIIGWDLILEYLFGAATVAVGLVGVLRRPAQQARRAPAGRVHERALPLDRGEQVARGGARRGDQPAGDRARAC
jgi:APA family basic amino acid/polyamine antiporter